MTITVEERIRRAAAQLDQAVADRESTGSGELAYFVEHPRRRRVVVTAVAAAVAVLVPAAVVVREGRRSPSVDAPASQVVSGEGWTRLPASPLGPRFQHLAVSTGSGVLFWGGYDTNGQRTDGAFFDVATNTWTKTPQAPLASDRGDAVGAWTGTEAVVVNGIDGKVKAAAYLPATNTWRKLPEPPLHNAANMMTKAVTVDGLVVVVTVSDEDERGVRNQVAVLDPATSTWRIGVSPAPFGSGFDAVAVGSEVVVVARSGFGGKGCGDSVVTAYDPVTNTWRPLPATPVVASVVASTGPAVFIVGNRCGESEARDAYQLDPAAGTWRATAAPPTGVIGDMRYGEVFTGRLVATFDAEGTPVFYDPQADRWNVGLANPLHRRIAETPWVAADGVLVSFSGGLSQAEGHGGTGCCRPLDGGYSYTAAP